MTKAFFIDRDGVINKDIGYLHEIEKFEFIDGVIDALLYIQSKGFKLIIVTNQSGIGRGMYSIEDFYKMNNWMINYLRSKQIDILEVFFCPHSPEENCYCRKPKPGLFFDAIKKFDIDSNKSWSVGDKETDIVAAQAANIGNTALVRSGHKIDERNTKANYIVDSLSHILDLGI